MIDLAEYIANLDEDNKDISLLYDDQDSTINKVEKLAKEIYSAGKVSWGPMTRTTLRQFENQVGIFQFVWLKHICLFLLIQS